MQRQNDLTQSVALQSKSTLCYSLTMTNAHTWISCPLHPSQIFASLDDVREIAIAQQQASVVNQLARLMDGKNVGSAGLP